MISSDKICISAVDIIFISVFVCSSHILDPRKRDVAFATASSEGEQTMRKDVECEIPADAVADGKCIIASYFIEGNACNNNN